MRRVATVDESPAVREAFIAGASIADTPASASSWAVVFRWPGQRRPVTEASGRIPLHIRSPEAEVIDPTVIPAYPGTILAAEWFACLQAIRTARRLDSDIARERPSGARYDPEVDTDGPAFFDLPPFADASPLRLHTTCAAIVQVLDGRAPLARRRWLREIQDMVTQMIDCRVVRMGEKHFIRPADRPYPGRKPQVSDAVPVYAQLIPQTANRRATRIARVALRLPERPHTPPW